MSPHMHMSWHGGPVAPLLRRVADLAASNSILHEERRRCRLEGLGTRELGEPTCCQRWWGQKLGSFRQAWFVFFLGRRWKWGLSSVSGVQCQSRVLWHPKQVGVGKDELSEVGKSG